MNELEICSNKKKIVKIKRKPLTATTQQTVEIEKGEEAKGEEAKREEAKGEEEGNECLKIVDDKVTITYKIETGDYIIFNRMKMKQLIQN